MPIGRMTKAAQGRRRRCQWNRGRFRFRQPVDAELGGDPLDLAGRHARGVHLGHGRRHRLVDAAVALQYPVGEVRAAPQLGYAQRDPPGGREQAALAVAVAAVRAALAGHVGLLVHDSVQSRFQQDPDELLRIEGAVFHRRRDLL